MNADRTAFGGHRFGLLAALATSIGLLFAMLGAAPAMATEFGLNGFDVTFSEGDSTPGNPFDDPPATQAGSHPFAITTSFEVNREGKFPIEELKDGIFEQVAGFIGDATAMPRCKTADFIAIRETLPECPDNTAVGITAVEVSQPFLFEDAPVYNLQPPPGVVARIGFVVLKEPATVDIGVKPGGEYNIVGSSLDVSQAVKVFGAVLQLWGNPADPAHDYIRGQCVGAGFTFAPIGEIDFGAGSTGSCPSSVKAPKPFLTLPRSCTGPATSAYEVDSWSNPGAWVSGSTLTHDNAIPPNPQGFTGCGKLGFDPTIAAQPTTKAANSPTGLDFSLDVHDEGLTNPTGLADADIEKAVVTLPEGFSTNPSLAEGLNVCTEADLKRETAFSEPGSGCPDESKIGTVEVETPLLEESVKGALFIAKPYENEVGSLLALYMVIKNPKLGIMVKQALEVEPDPVTGQLTTVAEDLPQLPFSHFNLHFREGTRSPLASPPLCGTYDAKAVLTPSSGTEPITTKSAFSIIAGPDNGPCPVGTPPFHPGLDAGTINNSAGHYSPFYLRLSRQDGEQEITHFSIKLPPGVIGKLAGIPYCSDQQIAQAKALTGPHGGQEELEHPSCPAASEVGRTLVGAGVGPSLTYVPGKLYLAGPYHGSNLSILSITAAKAGPFDLGTVVVREALKIDPETAEVFVDATGSDPIPHIIRGIPVHLRDIRVYVDRPQFVLNPTSCARTSTASTLLGSGLDFGSEADDQPVTVTTRFQAADCASLGFKPKLALSLKGGTKRGATPAFKAVLTYPKGSYANIAKSVVTLPRSEFLEQAHIGTVCTRVQFKEGRVPGEKCPAASIYGRASAVTPLLDEPLKGAVYLRSSSHKLPDLVAALHNNQVDFALDGHIDSVKNGRIRNTFETVPDAPVSKFVLEMQGGKKGLLVNSTNLCKQKNRAISEFTGQNGKVSDTTPVIANDCGGTAHKRHRGGKR